MGELFDSNRVDIKSQPLAYRMRPRTLDEYSAKTTSLVPDAFSEDPFRPTSSHPSSSTVLREPARQPLPA